MYSNATARRQRSKVLLATRVELVLYVRRGGQFLIFFLLGTQGSIYVALRATRDYGSDAPSISHLRRE